MAQEFDVLGERQRQLLVDCFGAIDINHATENR
jgi:hypothetical protein